MTNQEAIDTIKVALGQVEWDYPMDYAAAFDMAIKALKKQDDPDRVKVVRCRDCRFWEPENAEEGDSYGYCQKPWGTCKSQQTDMNWFCADGEREG